MKEINQSKTRRAFLKQSATLRVGGSALLSSVCNLRMMGQLAAQNAGEDEDYRALVCLFLDGGNDSYNMLAPAEGAGHDEYVLARGNLSYATSELLPFSNTLPDGRRLGLHESMPSLKAMYEAGDAAMIANVGTLIRPTTVSDIQNGVALPQGLFSHADQSQHWQSGLPQDRSAVTGWAGRMADILQETAVTGQVSMNLSFSGLNLLQSGESATSFGIDGNGARQLDLWENVSNAQTRAAMESLWGAEYDNVFRRAFAGAKSEAVGLTSVYNNALSAVELNSVFSPQNSVSINLRQTARSIAARAELGAKRQTFFIEVKGFDTHAMKSAASSGNLALIDTAIAEFFAAIEELGLKDKVTLFTASDFGRTLSSNGTGSDHAWGGNQFIVGGAVAGKQVFGEYPELAPGSALDLGRGRLLPTTSVDEYLADLALWMGVSPTDMGLVLPNLTNFHDVNDGPRLGLFSQA